MNKQKFQKSLQQLKGWRECAFILALAERALPNAMLFFDSIEHTPLPKGEFPYGLPELIEKIWDEDLDEEKAATLLDHISLCIPVDLESDFYGQNPAQDCLSLIEQALLTTLNSERDRAFDSSQLSLNTVIQFIEFSTEESLSENQIVKLLDAHPLIEREFSFQSEVHDLLRAASHSNMAVTAEIRALAQDGGVSNIGITLA